MKVDILRKQIFLQTVLNKIELAKKLFVLDIQRGSEVYIPPELSVNEFPISFRFYDPVFHLINKTIEQEKKTVYNLKT